MSQQDATPRSDDPTVEEAPPETPIIAAPEGQTAAEGPTIGTGTSLALGCVAGTVLLIVIGLLYILIASVF